MPGTRLIEGRDIKRMCELKGSDETLRHLSEALDKALVKPDDFSIRDLAEAFMGVEWLNNLRHKSGRNYHSRELSEAAAVSYADFSNITGQIIFSKINEGYADQDFVFQKEVPVIPSDIQDMEKIPGMGNIGDEGQYVMEGNEYPMVAFPEDWQEVAAKRKRGMIVPVTREAILGDKTGLILTRARKIGYGEGLFLEKRIIDAIIDENAGAVSAALGGHRYHWKGTTYASFQSSTPWANIQTSNALIDWTDMDNARQKLLAITDPYTGEPIMINARDIIVTPQNEFRALRILSATSTTTHAGGYAATGNLEEHDAPSPLAGKGYRVLTSQMLANRAATDTDWWYGSVKDQLARFVNWDMETEEAAADHPDRFKKDIQMQIRVSLKDAVSVLEPRAMVENQA